MAGINREMIAGADAPTFEKLHAYADGLAGEWLEKHQADK